MIDQGILQEIEEDLQRQRYEKLWKQYGHYVIAAALAIVLAAAVISGWRSWREYSEQKATAGLLTLVEGKADDKARQTDGLESFARAHPGSGHAALARLNAAAIAIKEGKTEQGISIYDSLAADESMEMPFRQLGDLLSVQAQLDSGDIAKLKSRLSPLTADGPWRLSARELSALLSLRAGEKEEAKRLYSEISKDGNAPSSMVQRANDMLRWIGEQE